MVTLDDGSLLLIGTHLSTEVLDDGAVRDSQGICDVLQVRDVCLHTVQATLLLQLHLRHGVSTEKKDQCQTAPEEGRGVTYLYAGSTIVDGMLILLLILIYYSSLGKCFVLKCCSYTNQT